MALPKLNLDPDAASYSVQLGEVASSVAVSQGPARRRRDHLGAVSVVDVQWVIDATQYRYLTAFRRTVLADGTLPFLMDLVLEDDEVLEYRCAFVVGTYNLNGVRGDARIVRAQLEVRPMPRNPLLDQGIVDLYESYGIEGELALNILEKLVTIDLPGAFY